MSAQVLILDFGSQYTQLIARRVREAGVSCEIRPFSTSFQDIRTFRPALIFLSGGPDSVTQAGSPRLPYAYSRFQELRHPFQNRGVSVVGICYGMQLMALENGGDVEGGHAAEYGPGILTWASSPLRRVLEWPPAGDQPGDQKEKQNVWLSHGDRVATLPSGFTCVAATPDVPISAMSRKTEEPPRWDLGLQFHPEVSHTERGAELIQALLFRVGGCERDWSTEKILHRIEDSLKQQLGNERVVMALSGGVDSTVAATILHRIVGDRLHCLFVDNGLLRFQEAAAVEAAYKKINLPVETIHAQDRFYSALNQVSEPEQKRKVIGKLFIDVFHDWIKNAHSDCAFLGQGTLYPDVIESVSVKGPSHTIKSHHNVGGLPANLPFRLVEPLRELFKDEVRRLGHELGVPAALLGRHPFPGPGLAVRIIGDVTREKVSVLQRADHIFVEQLKQEGLYDQIWQAGAVLTDTHSVGVKGDARFTGPVVALRAVTSVDGMTAEAFSFEASFLKRVANRILNEVKEVSRVVYDLSSKPPATIEWE